MRQVVIAVLVTSMFATRVAAQTPETPGPDTTPPPTEPTPVGVPVPVPVPVPVEPSEIEPTPPKPAQPEPVASAEQEIREIIVEDNTKTTSATVELISQLSVGDSWTPAMVDVVKTRLVSSGLFKDVEVYWTKVEGGIAVHILAKDKHSWVIAPAYYDQPTNRGAGVGFGENNLFGQNQKLLLYAQVATGDSFFIGAWVVPSIGGTRLYSQLDTFLKSSRNIEYSAPTSWRVGPGDVIPVRESRIHYLNFGGKIGVELWRGIKLDTRFRGASVSYKDIKALASIDDIDPGGDPLMPPKPGGEGMDISNEWTFILDRRANWYGIQSGHRYILAFEHSLPSLGSDFIYYLAGINLFKAWRILERHNLVLKGLVGYGHDLPFQQEYLTGGTSMRGWLNNQFRGDFRTLTNVEYSVPMFTAFGLSVRGLGFWDSAYTTFLRTNEMTSQRDYLPNSEVRGLAGLKNSVGVGTRFYLRQIVLPLLGLDFGYGLEARDLQIYLAIGLTD